jgi:hypothetical protein
MKEKKLSIITYCNNLQNLDSIYDSFLLSQSFKIHVNWYIIHSNENDYFYGKKIPNVSIFQIHNKEHKSKFFGYNLALDIISNGFIYFLDDDNIMHPDFWSNFLYFEENNFYGFLFHKLPKHISSNLNICKISNLGYKQYCISTSNHNFGTFSSYDSALSFYSKFLERHKNKINKLNLCLPLSPQLGYYASGSCCFHIKHAGNIRFNETVNSFQDFFSLLSLKSNFQYCFVDKILSYYKFLKCQK